MEHMPSLTAHSTEDLRYDLSALPRTAQVNSTQPLARLGLVTQQLGEAQHRREQECDGAEAEGEAHAPLAHLVLPAPDAARREPLVRRHLYEVELS